MKLRIALVACAVVAAGAFTGCKRINGKGEVQTRNYPLTGFNKVDLSNQGNVELVTDVNQFVDVKANENLFDILRIEVKDGRLELDTKSGYSIGNYDELTFYVHAPVLKEVSVSGSGDMNGGNGITDTNFLAKVSGSGEIKINGISGGYTEANISGSGDITLGGTTTQSKLTISGSGNIHAFNLNSGTTEARISGSGNIETTTNIALNVVISGSGNVKYKGHPSINTQISGSGNLTDAN